MLYIPPLANMKTLCETIHSGVTRLQTRNLDAFNLISRLIFYELVEKMTKYHPLPPKQKQKKIIGVTYQPLANCDFINSVIGNRKTISVDP